MDYWVARHPPSPRPRPNAWEPGSLGPALQPAGSTTLLSHATTRCHAMPGAARSGSAVGTLFCARVSAACSSSTGRQACPLRDETPTDCAPRPLSTAPTRRCMRWMCAMCSPPLPAGWAAWLPGCLARPGQSWPCCSTVLESRWRCADASAAASILGVGAHHPPKVQHPPTAPSPSPSPCPRPRPHHPARPWFLALALAAGWLRLTLRSRRMRPWGEPVGVDGGRRGPGRGG